MTTERTGRHAFVPGAVRRCSNTVYLWSAEEASFDPPRLRHSIGELDAGDCFTVVACLHLNELSAHSPHQTAIVWVFNGHVLGWAWLAVLSELSRDVNVIEAATLSTAQDNKQ